MVKLFRGSSRFKQAKKIVQGKITSKLIIIFVLLFLFNVAGLSSMYYARMSAVKKSDYIDSNIKILNLSSLNINNAILNLDKSIISIFQSDWMWDKVALNQKAPENLYTFDQLAFSSLMNVYTSIPDINRVILYLPGWERLYVMDGHTFETGGGTNMPGYDFCIPNIAGLDEDWFVKADQNQYHMVVTKKGESKLDRLASRENSYCFSRVLKDPLNGKKLAAVCIEMKEAMVGSILSDLVNTEENIFVIGKESGLFYKKGNTATVDSVQREMGILTGIDSEGYFYGKDDEKILNIYTRTAISDWYIIKSIPDAVLKKQIHKDIYFYLIYSAIALGVGIVIVILVSIKITGPIKELARKMKGYNGTELPVPIHYGKDEIGDLQRKFDEMSIRIHDLINIEYKLKLKEKDALIRAIHSRMNPHFLNNTLQTISALAIKSNNEDVEKITRSLKAMLQYNLNRTGSFTTLREELTTIRNYLDIQKYRFSDSLLVGYEIDPETLDMKIPPFIIQPIVENSFKYAMDNGSNLLRIKVSSYFDENMMKISVTDNGKGFKEGQIEEITSLFQTHYGELETGESNNGLLMINSIIKLSMGQEYGIRLFNERPEGATVILCLPGDRMNEKF